MRLIKLVVSGVAVVLGFASASGFGPFIYTLF